MDTTTELKQNNTFISNIYKKALFPCMLSILSANINVIVDGILVGQKLGFNALAAINLCMPINLLLCVIGSFISAGTAINASKYLSTKNSNRANAYYIADVYLSYIASVIITLLGVVFITPLTRFICASPDVIPYVHTYCLITIIGSIFKIMLYIPFWYLRLDGKNSQISVMMAILTFGNVILDVLFVFALNMGVFGAGLANIIATALSLLVGIYYLRDNDSSFTFSFKFNTKDISFKKIAMDGAPSSLNNLCSTIRILIINTILMAFGGAGLVAIFTAVNGVFSIGECIILGVPQASTAMLGVYIGEKDYNSCKLIVKYELIIGAILSGIFLVLCLVTSPFVGLLFGLTDNLFIPVMLMSISIFPSLLCQAFSSYYNIAGRNILSVVIIFLRLVVMTFIGLFLAIKVDINIFSFFIFAEVSTIIIIFIATGIIHSENKSLDRFLLCKMNNEISGKVLNFSVESDNEKICTACEQITDFCQNNGLSTKDTMKLQLAIEEALVLIHEVNKNAKEKLDGFDIRAFVVEDISGLRIRYNGLDFNPFEGQMDSSDYMGIKMISDMLETTIYKRTFGVNTLILLLKDNIND